jgi:glycine betaine/proline transport system ATP-binding protein
VRDFIANVNPLSVLTAWNVMRGPHELQKDKGGWIWLDRRKTTRFKLGKDNKVTLVERESQTANWVSCADADKSLDPTCPPVFWATPGTPLKTVMLAMHKSETAPVALFNEDNTFAGAIGVKDVLRAVLKRAE